MKQWTGIALVGAALFVGVGYYSLHPGSGPGLRLLQSAEAATTQSDYDGQLETRTLTPHGWQTVELSGFFHRSGLSRMVYQSPPLSGVVLVHGKGFNWRYDPSTRQVTVEKGAPATADDRELLLRQNYQISMLGHTRLAGRDVIELEVAPRHPGNPLRRFWIDALTHVLVGWARFAPNGQPQSVSHFRSIEFQPQDDRLFTPPSNPAALASPVRLAQPMSLAKLERTVGFSLVAPRWLPHGYHEEGHYLTRCADGCGAPVALSRYSDGLNSISLFQSPHVRDREGFCRVANTTNGYQVHLVRGGTDYVLIGDLEPSLLRRMALSLAGPVAASAPEGKRS